MAIPMPREVVEERISAINECGGNLSKAAIHLGIGRATLQNTVAAAKRYGMDGTIAQSHAALVKSDIPGRLEFVIENGVVLVGSDAHYYPGIISAAHRALVSFCREMRPALVIMNGDLLDGAGISRHPPIGWLSTPKLIDELEAVRERLGEITVAADTAQRAWCQGNHESRFETKLATVAPEYAGVRGIELADHFDPDWQKAWSVWINNTVTIKHRIKGGTHATHNNTLHAGISTVTGHLHSLKVTPFTDYRATRWGVDCGSLATPYGPQFEYMEDSPRSWRSGFAVLTFRNYELLWPEIVWARNETEVEFRGQVISV